MQTVLHILHAIHWRLQWQSTARLIVPRHSKSALMIIVSVCYVAYVRSSAHISKENFFLILKICKFQGQRTKICNLSQRVRKSHPYWSTDYQETTTGICCTLRITYPCWAILKLSVTSSSKALVVITRHHIQMSVIFNSLPHGDISVLKVSMYSTRNNFKCGKTQ